jgi:pimeloyl-ACP methyl ester carboxylesterase
MRGFGDSQWSGEQRYATTDHARDLSSIVDELDAGQVDLVGLSWGGLVALEATLSRPEAVRRLVMVDTPTHFAQSATDVPHLAESFEARLEAWDAWRATSPNADPEMLELMADHGTRPGPGGRLFVKQDPYFLSRWPFRDDDYRGRLGDIAQPTLVIRAGASPVLSGLGAAETVDALPQGRYVQIADSGHLVPVDNPVDLAAEIVEFLAEPS